MSRPAAKRLARAALAALAAGALACTSDSAEVCPGEPVATLAFTGVRVSQGALDPALDDDPAAPDCEAGLGHPAELAPFTGAVSTDPGSGTAALCRAGDGAQPLYGTLVAGRLAVETATEGAVLGSPCAGGCVATLALALRGSFSGTGAALRFDGAVIERLAVRAGAACGGCALPCAARYAVTGLPVPP